MIKQAGRFVLFSSLLLLGNAIRVVSAAEETTTEYRVFPRRTVEEAAVLEWGNSAIITALDASVALFGPQTKDAALLEVETAPVLAVPLDGLRAQAKQDYQEYLKRLDDNSSSKEATTESDTGGKIAKFQVPIAPLDNADEIAGNLCIMTTHPGVSGVELALMAQASGAAAVLVVNVQNPTRPDDIYRLTRTLSDSDQDDPRAAEIDIPVVMISLNSAQMLATALLDPESPQSHELVRQAGFSTKYMPERVRLYAGDDRPFFEDVEATRPTIYLIHDLLKKQECDSLIQQAEAAGLNPLSSSSKEDWLQYTSHPSHYENVDRVTLWQGLLMTAAAKQIEERMEQVTSFPVAHYSDFVIDRLRLDGTSQILPHHTVLSPSGTSSNNHGVPVATMTIFLSDMDDVTGGEILYPAVLGAESKKRRVTTPAVKPIHIQPRKGMAVIHHSANERGQLDTTALQGILPVKGKGEYFYVAHKYIFMDPVSTSRRVVLPMLALPSRGRLPGWVVLLHDRFVEQFGYDSGSVYFDKVCVFLPLLLFLLLVQYVVGYVKEHYWDARGKTSSSDKAETSQTAAVDKKKKRSKRE